MAMYQNKNNDLHIFGKVQTKDEIFQEVAEVVENFVQNKSGLK